VKCIVLRNARLESGLWIQSVDGERKRAARTDSESVLVRRSVPFPRSRGLLRCEFSLLRSDLRSQCELGFYPVGGFVPRNAEFFTAFTDEVCLELNFLECRVLDFPGASDLLGRFLGSALSLHNGCWSVSRHRCR